jgi:hypothetical protein
MPSPEGNRPHNLDLRSLRPLPQKRDIGSGGKRPASQPEGHHEVPSYPPSAGERQENQDRRAILPSYYTDILREGDSRWLHPKKDKELLRGWDSLAEYALDLSDLVAKPHRPNIPEDDIEALSEDEQLTYGMTADEWEEEVLFALDVAEDRHLIPEFKRDMQEYRKAVKGIVQLWREEGLL